MILLKDDYMNGCFLPVFESLWNTFQFDDHNALIKITKNPWSLVSVYDEKYKDDLPDYLKQDLSKIRVLKDTINKFIALGKILYSLKKKKITPFDEYPFKFEGRDVYYWRIGDIITVDDDTLTLVYCHIKIGKYGYTRYIVMDPEFFLLVEPEQDTGDQKTVALRTKEPLRNIRFTSEGSDSKIVSVGVYTYDSEGEKSFNEFQLIFENSINLKSVKRTLEDNKKQQLHFLSTQVDSFFDY